MTEGSAEYGVYVHIPFCRAKCRYCDFNSYAGRAGEIGPYLAALAAEMAATAPTTAGARARTLYIGGGTPSLLAADQVGAIVGQCRRLFGLSPDEEVTLEANPGTVDTAYLADVRAAGVNRLSLGVQSFDDGALRFLGRIHSAAAAIAAYEAARRAGFANVSLDLIYALPGQPQAHWQGELRQALALRPEHLSLYALSVEEGTPLAAMVAAGEVVPATGDEAAALYELADETMAAAGYAHYEIANWARPDACGDLARSRHNLGYWHNEPYLGFGAGAHSYFGGHRYWNEREPQRYIALVAAGGRAVAESLAVGHGRAAADTLMLGLRLAEGIDLDAFAERHGCDLRTVCAVELAELAGYGLLECDGRCVWLTLRGRLLANDVLVRLLSGLQAV